jgi:putative methionine-R-sulfoxide reductase with GAF domain
MPLFEVFIPSAEPDGFNITARIRADTWINALRNGLSRLGDTAEVKDVLCDITEEGIHVTEPRAGRVFRIREVPDAQAAPAAKALVSESPERAPAPRLTSPQPSVAPMAPTPSGPSPFASASGRFAAPAVAEEAVRREKALPGATAGQIGRLKQTHQAHANDDTIADLFASTQRIFAMKQAKEAADFMLDLAMRTVPSDSGAVFIADINASDLYFAAARGPKAGDVMKFRVPMGQGIVGFSAQEGVSLGVSDVQRDPRFYAAVSTAVGYEVRSILCAPAIQDGRVFGAIELINKTRDSSFTQNEVELLNYLARVFADYLVSTGQTGD